MRASAPRGRRRMSQPSAAMRPEVGATRPRSIPRTVVFPAPLPPSSATVSPLSTAKLTASTASADRYRLVRSTTRRAGSGMALP